MRRISLIALSSISVFAGPIGIYSFTGTATGTIGKTSFTSAPLTVSAPCQHGYVLGRRLRSESGIWRDLV